MCAYVLTQKVNLETYKTHARFSHICGPPRRDASRDSEHQSGGKEPRSRTTSTVSSGSRFPMLGRILCHGHPWKSFNIDIFFSNSLSSRIYMWCLALAGRANYPTFVTRDPFFESCSHFSPNQNMLHHLQVTVQNENRGSFVQELLRTLRQQHQKIKSNIGPF